MPVRDDILAPIPGANPVGIDLLASGDTAILDIREARKEDPPGSRREEDGPPRVADWARVLKLCNDTLATKSKDLEVACYLTEALLKREGLAGFRAGLGVLKGLMDQYWDTMYPALEESPGEPPFASRIAKLEWLGARYPRLGNRNSRAKVGRGYLHPHFQAIPICKAGHGLFQYNEARDVGSEAEANDAKKRAVREERIAEGKLTIEDFNRCVDESDKAYYKALAAELSQTVAALDALKQVTKVRFAGADTRDGIVWDYDALTDELKELTEVVGAILTKKLETDPDPIEMVAEPQPGVVVAEGAAAEASPWSEPRNAEEAASRVSMLAEFLRKASPTNPGPYLMLRGLRWGELRMGGATVDPKLLVAPPTHVRSLLKGLSLDGRWKDLLEQAERVMAKPDGRGWLDLQRHVVTSCDNLGSEYERVGAAIRSELALLLRDLPTLADMTLMDDTPTANGETRQWLRDQGLMNLALDISEEARVASAGPAVRPREGGDSVYERAMEAVRAGNAQRGVEVLMAEAARERSPRGRWLRMTQVAAVMVDADMKPQASPILDQLEDAINEQKLAAWEAGDVVAQPLALLYRCLPEDSGRRGDLYQLICRLDPVRAIGLR